MKGELLYVNIKINGNDKLMRMIKERKRTVACQYGDGTLGQYQFYN